MKTRDIAIIAAVGVAAYLLLKKQAPARGYSIDVPAPDILSRQEYERQLANQRRLDAIKNLATTAGDFINKIFGKQKIATVEKKSLSAGINPVVGPKKIGLIY
jgi:hypothetical protein